MKKYYKVSFQYSESVYCSNIAHAETAADVEAHYSKYPWYSVKEAASYEVEEATRKGMPIIEVEPAQVEKEAQNEQKKEGENTMNTNIIDTIKKEVEARTERSAWSKGVTAYALELVEGLEEAIDGGYFDVDDLEAPKLVERALLNGASDWSQYSWGGSSLIYDGDIAERLCCPSELKKTRNGERRPNSREEWLDVQARALYQACNRVKKAVRAALAA